VGYTVLIRDEHILSVQLNTSVAVPGRWTLQTAGADANTHYNVIVRGTSSLYFNASTTVVPSTHANGTKNEGKVTAGRGLCAAAGLCLMVTKIWISLVDSIFSSYLLFSFSLHHLFSFILSAPLSSYSVSIHYAEVSHLVCFKKSVRRRYRMYRLTVRRNCHDALTVLATSPAAVNSRKQFWILGVAALRKVWLLHVYGHYPTYSSVLYLRVNTIVLMCWRCAKIDFKPVMNSTPFQCLCFRLTLLIPLELFSQSTQWMRLSPRERNSQHKWSSDNSMLTA
jgi:hypothetical protein